MSGLPPLATELRTSLEVRFVPLNEPAHAGGGGGAVGGYVFGRNYLNEDR